jgi:hypothetical protein
VHSRYLELFIVNGQRSEPPYSVGNLYLLKKLKDVRTLGQRIAKKGGGPGTDKLCGDVKVGSLGPVRQA